jgi:hypothetical protein
MPIISPVGLQVVRPTQQTTTIIGVTKHADTTNTTINPAKDETVKAQPSFNYGQTTVGTSAVQLTTTSTPCVKGVLVKALAANTAKVYIGNNSVTTSNGYELSAGQEVFIQVDDVNKLYAISTTTGQKVCWIGV